MGKRKQGASSSSSLESNCVTVEVVTMSWQRNANLKLQAGATYLVRSWRVLPIRRLRRPLALRLWLRCWWGRIRIPLRRLRRILIHCESGRAVMRDS